MDASVAHYTRKLNFRRDLNREVVREGVDYYLPFGLTGDYQTIPFPGANSPITLIHRVVRPNGETSLVVGTKTDLYRMRYNLDGYIESSPVYSDGVGGSPYWEVPARWQVIGSGFSTSGRRWEVESVDGTSTFNNGVDLTVSFRHEWDSVVPNYELREQGVVSVGTISSMSGVLLGGDVTELSTGAESLVIEPLSSGVITVSQAGFKSGRGTSTGTVVTASAASFSASDVGRSIVWSSGAWQTIISFISSTVVTVASGTAVTSERTFRVTDSPGSATFDAYKLTASSAFFTAQMVGTRIAWADGTCRKIISVVSPTVARTDIDYPVPSGAVQYENPLAYISSAALKSANVSQMVQRQYRIIWSELNQPTRYAIIGEVSFTLGSRVLTTTRSFRSFSVGDVVTVTQAGILGSALTDAIVTSVGPGKITISKPALSSGTGAIQRASSVGSIVGQYDIQDDGSGILKMVPLNGRLVVYKNVNIFLGRFTGSAENPFVFDRIVVPHGRSLYFRNTIVSLQDTRHVFAGKDRFYAFDLTQRQPIPIPDADMVSDQFYKAARLADTDSIFAVDNSVTQEIWVVCPSAETPTLCWDYLYSTFSQTDINPSAAAVVNQNTNRLVSESGDLFLLGTAFGVVTQYGRSTEPVSAWVSNDQPWMDGRKIYYRRMAKPFSETKSAYNAVLSSGLMHFGSPYHEKHLERYVLGISSIDEQSTLSGQPSLTVSFYQAIGQRAPQVLIGSTQITDLANHGMVPIHAEGHLFRDEISGAINQNPVGIHDRTFDTYVIGSKSHHRK